MINSKFQINSNIYIIDFINVFSRLWTQSKKFYKKIHNLFTLKIFLFKQGPFHYMNLVQNKATFDLQQTAIDYPVNKLYQTLPDFTRCSFPAHPYTYNKVAK